MATLKICGFSARGMCGLSLGSDATAETRGDDGVTSGMVGAWVAVLAH
jgi:hypothetical protein